MKRMLTLAVLAVLVGTPLAAQQTRPGLAEAQAPPMRRGLYFQLGFGGGQEQLDLDWDNLGYSDPLWALTFNFRGGFTAHPNVRLGVDFHSWIRPDGPVTETASSIMPNVQLYPLRNYGLHVRGGAGYAWSSISTNEAWSSSITYGGWGTNLGAGWEFPLSRKVALTPTFDWYQYWINNAVIGSYTERILAVGLGVTFQLY
jgi:hypothetical protein